MPDSKKDSASQPQRPSNERRSDETERLEQEEADEMASAAQKRERQYDQDHDIFTK